MSRYRRTFYHDDTTEPILPDGTGPLPASYFPRESRTSRFARGIRNFFSSLINKINQLVALALTILLLLLFARFILHFFTITLSQFAQWVYLITGPFAAPFNGLHPPLNYNGYSIDISILVAMLVYIVLAIILRRFLSILATWSRDY